MAVKDVEAFNHLGGVYMTGSRVPQDLNKAFDLWSQAAELGSIRAHNNLAGLYYDGLGVEREMKKTIYHWEHAAMGGFEPSRHNLGILEKNAGNMHRAMKHFLIAAGGGYDLLLELVKQGYLDGVVRTLRTR